jgi:hemerythrin-like domain-containing protein
MRTLPKAKTWITFFFVLGFFALLMNEVARETPSDGARRTEPIRRNLDRLRRILLGVERQFESVHEVNEAEQIVLMQSAVGVLKEYLLPHLSAEEAALYPELERTIPPFPGSVTPAMKREHDLLRQWIAELETLANAPLPDHNAFARRGERLLGLIEAHFEVEESVIFPLLDQAAPLTKVGVRGKPGITD